VIKNFPSGESRSVRIVLTYPKTVITGAKGKQFSQESNLMAELLIEKLSTITAISK
jgi:hypothetical protein